MKTRLLARYAARLLVGSLGALLLLSACRGPTPIAGRVTETAAPAVRPDTPAAAATVVPSTEPLNLPVSATAQVSPTSTATLTGTPPPHADTPTPTPTPSIVSASTKTPTPDPAAGIEAGKFTLTGVGIEKDNPVYKAIAPYVAPHGEFDALDFEGRVFQNASGTLFILRPGQDVSQQMAWLEKYASLDNLKQGVIKSSEYTPLGKGKVVIVGDQAVYVYRDGKYTVTSIPKIVRSDSSQSMSGQQYDQFALRFPRVWWSEDWGAVVVSDENNIVISHQYDEATNTWKPVSPLEPKAQLKTPEQIYAEWRRNIEAPGNIVGFTPQEKAKLLRYFDALAYVKPEKTAQILKLFPWFHAPFSPDNPLRFLVDVQQIINNKGKGIWSGGGSPSVKLDLAFLKDCSEETNWWMQVSGIMKEAMTNRWTLRYTANFLNDEHYGDIAANSMGVAIFQDLLDAKKDNGAYVISNPQTRREVQDLIKGYTYGFNREAKQKGWSPSFP